MRKQAILKSRAGISDLSEFKNCFKIFGMYPGKLTSLIAMLLTLCLTWHTANSQTTPVPVNGAFTDADCPPSFGDADNFTQFTEYEENNNGGLFEAFGEATMQNGSNSIGLIYEFHGSTGVNDNTSNLLVQNGQNLSVDDEFIFIFDQDLGNPLVRFGGMDLDNHVCITDLEGNPISAIGTEGNPSQDANGCWFDNGVWVIQITDTVDAIRVVVDVEDADAYTIGIFSCMLNIPPEPLPLCTTCPSGTKYDFLELTNFDELTMMGDIEVNGDLYGSFEVVSSDLDIRNDTKGKMFGGFDRDGGTQLLHLTFCQPLAVGELDIRNLEVESEVSIGTMASSMDASAALSGLTLTQCAGSSRMGVDPNPANGVLNFVKTDPPGCGANPNGTYTIDSAIVSELYFKYHNPTGGCSIDYIGFRIGSCVPDPAITMAVPECPLTLVDAGGMQFIRNEAGQYFDVDDCSDAAFVNAVNNMTPFPVVVQSFCPDMVLSECSLCNMPTECPPGQSIYTVFHVDETQGYLPGGICVETTVSGTVSDLFQVSGDEQLAGAFVNTPNNITDGGSFIYKTLDGDNGQVIYDFCSDIVNPYIYIGKTGPEKNTVISVFEADGTTEIPIVILDGQPGFTMSGTNGFTATIQNRQGYGQIQDGVPRSAIIVKFDNGPRYTNDWWRLGIGVCAPDIVQAQPVCPIGLFSWEKDGVEQYKVYVDATGASFYAKDDLCNETSLGDLVFPTTGPICGTLVPIATNCLVTGCENIIASGSPYSATGPITVSNDCPDTTVILSDFLNPAFIPAGGVVSYHDATPVSGANEITDITIEADGTYYAAYTVPGQSITQSQEFNVVITMCDPCDAAFEDPAGICALINGDPNHPLANLDCDQGGVSNIIECNAGLDPDDPADDAIPCNAGSAAPVLIGNN